MSCPIRTYPLKRPDGHQPPVPRWQLVFGLEVTNVHIAYIGVQRHSDAEDVIRAGEQAINAVRGWIDKEAEDGFAVTEEFDVIDGDDAGNAHVWACYWADEAIYKSALEQLSLSKIHDALSPAAGRSSIGLWLETFTVPPSRLETNYTGLDYLPGVARLPNTTTEPHTLTAYWGAARDRIPDSAHDLFETKNSDEWYVRLVEEKHSAGAGRHILGTNADNLVHIRSGQFWETCDDVEADAYERQLEPTLEAGLRYLWENPSESGARGLRYLRNTDTANGSGNNNNSSEEEKENMRRPRRETCVAGYFTSLDKLEGWAKSHKSHLAIYHGAMRHAKVFGDTRRFRTWHEVVILKKGEARFEYVNCVDKTGVLRFIAPDGAVNNAVER
jgi:hypothetical protein